MCCRTLLPRSHFWTGRIMKVGRRFILQWLMGMKRWWKFWLHMKAAALQPTTTCSEHRSTGQHCSVHCFLSYLTDYLTVSKTISYSCIDTTGNVFSSVSSLWPDILYCSFMHWLSSDCIGKFPHLVHFHIRNWFCLIWALVHFLYPIGYTGEHTTHPLLERLNKVVSVWLICSENETSLESSWLQEVNQK